MALLKVRIEGDIFLAIADDMRQFVDGTPGFKQRFLNAAGQEARNIFQMIYEGEPGPGHHLPTKWTGAYGNSFRFYATPQGTLTLSIVSPYADAIEEGRQPGEPMSRSEMIRVAMWVQSKIGTRNQAVVSRMILHIEENGTPGQHILARTVDLNGWGRQWILWVEDSLDRALAQYFSAVVRAQALP